MTVTGARPGALDLALLDDALRHANIPALAVVTHQLTGDPVWLSDRYRPTRAKGMDENRSGGLPEDVQDEVRRGAASAIEAWSDGAPVAVPELRGDRLIEVLSFMNGEDVPAEYELMMAEMLGFASPESHDAHDSPAPNSAEATAGLSVIVVGAGVSGMLASLRLTEAGVRHVVLEKNREVGGGWWRTPTRAAASTPRASSTPTRSSTGTGRPTSASATRSRPTSRSSPTPTTCAVTCSSTARSRASPSTTRAPPGPPSYAEATGPSRS